MAETPTVQPQRMSRYRSQRTVQEARALDASREPQPPLPVEEATVDEQLTRRNSRYNRTGPNTSSTQQTLRPKTAPAPEHLDVVQRRQSKRDSQVQPIVQANLQRKPSARRYRDARGNPLASPELHPAVVDSEARRVGSNETKESDEDGRRQRLKEQYTASHVPALDSPKFPPPAKLQPSVQELFPPPKAEPVQPAAQMVRLDGPPASAEIRATKSTSALPNFVDPEDEDEATVGCFSLFKRKRNEPAPYIQEKTQVLRPKSSRTSMLHAKKSREKLTIKPGGGGVVPGIDAPISAVNARDRQVIVVCGKSRAIFPVNPMTTPVDIMKSASKGMPGRIDVKSAVLLEDFMTVGVQRPLRRYEHVRDVMNSWDGDEQNSLILVDPGTGTSEAELTVSGVPQEKPGDESWFLDFSQVVGKWDRRYITLRSDGQMTLQKDLKTEHINICHLSDFDIYRPTQEKIRKKIKPPKRFCFAIKSQQKTSYFESTHNFVHFFCTNDRPTADAFYAAVQGWRSWYLVNIMGEGRKPKPTKRELEKPLKEMGLQDDYGAKHPDEKALESWHQLPRQKPLRAMDRHERPLPTAKSRDVQAPPPVSPGFTKSSNQLDPGVSPERRSSTVRKQQYPPVSIAKRALLAEDEPLVNLGRKESVHRRRPSLDERRSNSEDVAPTRALGRSTSQRQKDTGLARKYPVNRRRASIGSNADEFAPTGLLGTNYSQRQKEYAERENHQKVNPFTSGPNLVNTGLDTAQEDSSPNKSPDAIQRRHSTRAQHVHRNTNEGGIQRTTSQRKKMQMPEPLIDLTPQYREPPQHLKKGRGFIPEKIGEGGLIDNATSPEDPLGVPPSTDWRAGRNVNNAQNATMTLVRNANNARSTKRPQTARETPAAFTGEGLLAGAQAQQGWGTTPQGRGIMDGSRARGPMVDLSEESIFVQGSLVAKVEAERPPQVPIIDRSREDE